MIKKKIKNRYYYEKDMNLLHMSFELLQHKKLALTNLRSWVIQQIIKSTIITSWRVVYYIIL